MQIIIITKQMKNKNFNEIQLRDVKIGYLALFGPYYTMNAKFNINKYKSI